MVGRVGQGCRVEAEAIRRGRVAVSQYRRAVMLHSPDVGLHFVNIKFHCGDFGLETVYHFLRRKRDNCRLLQRAENGCELFIGAHQSRRFSYLLVHELIHAKLAKHTSECTVSK